MKTAILIITAAAFVLLPVLAFGQTKTVLKNVSGNTITENLTFPSGKTLTIAAGATINATGATITGFGSGGGSPAWGDITGTIASQTDLNTALGLKAPLASPTFTGTVTIPSGASISGYLTAATAASTYAPIESPTFTGTVTIPDGASISGYTTELNPYFNGGLTWEHVNTTLGTQTSTLGIPDEQASMAWDMPAESGRLLTNNTPLNGSNITSGTVADARLSANVSLLGQTISLATEVTGTLPITNGGTGQTTASAARIALLPSMTGNGGKFLRVNAGATDYELASISGGGDALTSGTLAQFAATTSAQLRGVLSDENGTGEFLTTNGSAASLTSFPTLNQSTTGNAATATALQTGRTINGTTFDGTANITVTAAAGTLTGTTLASGVTASSLTSLGTIATGVWQGTAIADSYISSASTWNAKEAALTFSTGLTRSTNTITVNTSQNIATLSNLTTNGILTTTGSAGTLTVDTTTKPKAEAAEIGVAISDETTAITTGTAKITFRMPFALTVTAVRLSLTTVSSSGTPTVDINEAGTTILSTKLSCDASEKTSTTAATAAVISDTSLADDAEITIDVDTAGTGATGAKVWIIGTR
jgi:hypothetical protein